LKESQKVITPVSKLERPRSNIMS